MAGKKTGEDMAINTIKKEKKSEKQASKRAEHQWAMGQLQLTKHTTTIRVPESKREKTIFEEIMSLKFPDFMETMNPHIKEGQWTPSKRNKENYTPRDIKPNCSKPNTEKTLKVTEKWKTCYIWWNKDKNKSPIGTYIKLPWDNPTHQWWGTSPRSLQTLQTVT